MLNSNEAQWAQDQDQEKFCPGNGSAHDEKCMDMDEFNQLLAKVSTKVLWFELMTYQQRLNTVALWEACNYGGRPTPGDLKHMEPKRDYAEWILRMEHRKQWKNVKKSVKLDAI
jgi:hypothetical protein